MIDWIKIEDGCKLPTNHSSVLIAHGGIWEEGYYENGKFAAYWPDDGDLYYVHTVTHWAFVNHPDGN